MSTYLNLSAAAIQGAMATTAANEKSQGVPPVLPGFASLSTSIQYAFSATQDAAPVRAQSEDHALAFIQETDQSHKYAPSPVKGPDKAIYPVAPNELLEPNLGASTDIDQKSLLVYYFENLYPLTRASGKWRRMSKGSLQDYYDTLQFWYIFNTAWTASPMPVTLSDTVYKNWEKCTFYQAGTIIQSPITSWGLGGRGNNGPQDGVTPSYTYTAKNGKRKTIKSVTTDRAYWDVACGTKMEVTSWGWNPYPFGIYAQGPFNGTGNFLQLPQQEPKGGAIVGTCHWDIIHQCKAEDARDSAVWASIFNHELHDGGVHYGMSFPFATLWYGPNNWNTTPLIVIKDLRTGKYEWSNLLGQNKGGYTPLLTAYFSYYVGGFGGIGGAAPWDNTWKHKTYRYTPLYMITPEGHLAFPEDQSIPASAGLPGGFHRESSEFWEQFAQFFSLLQAWDTDWSKEKWRHAVYNNAGVGPSVANPSDSLMMAYATGNFELVRWSTWLPKGWAPIALGSALGEIDPTLCKFSSAPARWSYYQTPDGYVMPSTTGTEALGFPVGIMTDPGAGYSFVVRTQMPNVNYDICSEFADFRVSTPGQLATGLGDQGKWKELFTEYAQKYMFTADPDDTSNSHSFSGKYAIRLPKVDLIESKPKIEDWKIANNVGNGTTFFGFDVLSGRWDSNPAVTGMSNNIPIMLEQDKGFAGNGGVISIFPKGNCTSTVEDRLVPPGVGDSLKALTGGAVTDASFASTPGCKGIPWTKDWVTVPVTNAPAGTTYFPSPVDSFGKAIVGFQANGTNANLGAPQTRWIMSSKGIPWSYSAPLSNRLLLLRGASIVRKDSRALQNSYIMAFIFLLIALVIGGIMYYRPQDRNKPGIMVVLAMSGLIGIVLLIIAVIQSLTGRKPPVYMDETEIKGEAHRLRTYLTLVYPSAPVSRWNKMSVEELRIFFCSLHFWYKGVGLPSPIDYLGSKYWTETVPFGKGSSWKTFCLRKNCVENVAAPAFNELDGKLCVGHNDLVPTPANESPSAIIWTGRQLQSLGAQGQQTTFFHPSQNYHIDTYNSFPTVNDTGLHSWEKARHVEVSSQWGPFPDGIYYDWAPGTGVWLNLGKHKVGYNGLDLVRRLGLEAMSKGIDLDPIYQEAWQKTGLSSMVLSDDNVLSVPEINWPDYHSGFGWYGTVAMTNAQIGQINAVAKSMNATWLRSSPYGSADGKLFQQIAAYVTPQYLVEKNGKWIWTNDMPSDPSYVPNYPLPLPYYTTFQNNGKGLPKTNPLALRLPWGYQLFNVCAMMRGFCIDLLFLDDGAIDTSRLEGLEYVDWLKANEKKPLAQTRSWSVAIDRVNKLLASPNVHPLFLIYGRIHGKGPGMDGPQFILGNQDVLVKSVGLLTVQTGALNATLYAQTTNKLGGATYTSQENLPQSGSANLEIDHWLPMLGRPMGYEACVRIQHWCGNKSLSLDIEIINISQQISGNLISNMPTDSIYEVWKKGGEERLSVRDPFADDAHVYFEDGPVDKVRRKYHPMSSKAQRAKWTAPPWIQYRPHADQSKRVPNVYGWPAEDLSNFMTTNRLSYCPANVQQVTLSGSYPEYNQIIFDYMVKNEELLK